MSLQAEFTKTLKLMHQTQTRYGAVPALTAPFDALKAPDIPDKTEEAASQSYMSNHIETTSPRSALDADMERYLP